ncbi:MAG: hypothetical protein WCN81_00785, partial [Actinomycetes bacterium]
MSTDPRPPRGGGPRPPQGGDGPPPSGGEPPFSGADRVRRARREARRRQLRRRRIIALAVIVLVVLVVPPTISYAMYMRQASSVSWKIRSVEWVRDNHGAWLVNFVERTYYSVTAPKKGGPGLTALPTVATDSGSATPKPSKTAKAAYTPPAVKPAISPALAGEGGTDRRL